MTGLGGNSCLLYTTEPWAREVRLDVTCISPVTRASHAKNAARDVTRPWLPGLHSFRCEAKPNLFWRFGGYGWHPVLVFTIAVQSVIIAFRAMGVIVCIALQ